MYVWLSLHRVSLSLFLLLSLSMQKEQSMCTYAHPAVDNVLPCKCETRCWEITQAEKRGDERGAAATQVPRVSPLWHRHWLFDSWPPYLQESVCTLV